MGSKSVHRLGHGPRDEGRSYSVARHQVSQISALHLKFAIQLSLRVAHSRPLVCRPTCGLLEHLLLHAILQGDSNSAGQSQTQLSAGSARLSAPSAAQCPRAHLTGRRDDSRASGTSHLDGTQNSIRHQRLPSDLGKTNRGARTCDKLRSRWPGAPN